MADKYPTPKRVDGQWVVDLRAWGFSGLWRTPLGPASLSEVEAVNRAWARLQEAKDARRAEPGAQLELGARNAPELFSDALDAWVAERTYDTTAGERGAKQVITAVRRDFGAYRLAEFADPVEGRARLLAWLRSVASLSGVTVRWRLSVVFNVFRLCVERGWLRIAPTLPDDYSLPKIARSKFEYTDNPTFRAARAECFRGASGRTLACAEATGESVAIYCERRRVGYSIVMYTGLHPRDVFGDDADFERDHPDEFVPGFTDAHCSLDFGIYVRENSKSAGCVPVEQFPMPEWLIHDLRGLLALLERAAFLPGERIAGGAWAHPERVLKEAARRLKLSPGFAMTPRLLRKTFAREMFKRGKTVKQVADMMGHVDTRMLEEIYARTPRPPGHEVSPWTMEELAGAPTGPNGPARVLHFDRDRR